MVALAIVQQVIKGNAGFFREFMERVEGRVQPPKDDAKQGELSKLDSIPDSLDAKYGAQPEATSGLEPGAGAVEPAGGRGQVRKDV